GGKVPLEQCKVQTAPPQWVNPLHRSHPTNSSNSCSQEQALAFSVMAASFLVPAAWILAHVEHYKSRSD
uniref:Uncharacterized protein n=1 Tax=Otus sunia TaxID=257818 RepID=A0A8C8ASX2_9STRI